MNNLVVLPIVIPLLTGMLLILFKQYIQLQRTASFLALVGTTIVHCLLLFEIKQSGVQAVQMGSWPAPFGITLATDMFSALLLLTSNVVALICLLFAFHSLSAEIEETYFYSLFLFLITGVNGSFITGDLFNLYVFFEVLLIASYVLVSIGGKKKQLREAMKYVVINVLSSSLFLFAIAYLYSITGTLNLAHLSVRVAEAGQDALITAVSLLLLIVLSIKAGLFLFFWLPGSYSAPPTVIAAVFAALLTKVGIYGIIRMFSLIFYHETHVTHLFIGILAALTMILGGLGASGYGDIKKILTYNVVIGAGFILAGLAAFSPEALNGSIFYLIHDMISKALVFLIGGIVIHLTGTTKLEDMSGLIRTHPALGWMFFITILALAGIPPLSGFIGKVLVTEGTFVSGYYWLGAIGLLASIMILYSLLKIFMNAFWGETILSVEEEKGTTKGLMLPVALLTTLTIVIGIFAQVLVPYVDLATYSLLNPEVYIEAVFSGNPIP